MTPSTMPAGRLPPELMGQIAALPRESKEDLLALLEEELNAADPPEPPAADPGRVKAAWKDELGKRVRDIQEGKVELVDAHESLARMRERLREKYGV